MKASAQGVFKASYVFSWKDLTSVNGEKIEIDYTGKIMGNTTFSRIFPMIFPSVA